MGQSSKPSPRQVAVAIPYRGASTSLEVCLVSSRKHLDPLKWVLPKGGVESGESSRQAAIREMWEEAGLRPASAQASIPPPDSAMQIADHKPHPKSPSSSPSSPDFVPRAIYTAHELLIASPADKDAPVDPSDWPESSERQRRWVSLEEADRLVAWRKDISTLLRASRIWNASGA